MLSSRPVKQEKASIRPHDKARPLNNAKLEGQLALCRSTTYCSSEPGSENVVSGHLEGRHGLVDVLVQAVILHGVAGTQTVLPAAALSQEEDLPLVVIGDVNDCHQESQDDQMEEEVGVLILRVVAVCSLVTRVLHPVWLQPAHTLLLDVVNVADVVTVVFIYVIVPVVTFVVIVVVVIALIWVTIQIDVSYWSFVSGLQQVWIRALCWGQGQSVGGFGV